MIKRSLALLLCLSLLVTIVGCNRVSNVSSGEQFPKLTIGISKHPEPANFGRGELKSLPKYDPSSDQGWQVDIRGYDLSKLALDSRLGDLLHADFDSVTKWPEKLPAGFDPDAIMELGKDPGLNVRTLHEQGITGKGISVAIIDQTLLVDHNEYKDRLLHYEEFHNLEPRSAMHGAAVASIAVGKTVGVAPEANLYYIAETHGEGGITGFTYDFTWLAKSVDRIVEINSKLPADQKIRVLAMAIGWSSSQKGYTEIVEAVERAKAAGIFVVSSSLYNTYNQQIYFHALGRGPNADPNDPHSYGPGSWWARRYYNGEDVFPREPLLLPMDSRCTASPTGVDDYVFYSQGGWSWTIPYIAGMYALACQVNPNITPEDFWAAGLETGDTIEIVKDAKTFALGKIVNPVKLMEAIAEK